MPDANGLNPGQPGYNAASDPNASADGGTGTNSFWKVNAPPANASQSSGAPPPPAPAPSSGTPPPSGTGTSQYSFPIPPGFNPSNPVDKLVLDQFQANYAKGQAGDSGSLPTLANMTYWRDQINQTGGATASNLAYWTTKMGGSPSSSSSSSSSSGGPVAGITYVNGQYVNAATGQPEPDQAAAATTYQQAGGTPPASSSTGITPGAGANPYGNIATGNTPDAFVAPTAAQAMASPGTQEGLALGEQAIQSSAAATGDVLSGGTLKALEQFGQTYGATQYGNVYNQALTGYTTNVGTQQGSQQAYLAYLNSLYGGAPSTATAPTG